MRKLLCMLIGLVGCYSAGYAQKTISNDRGATIALKTNALYWGTTTPNLGMEVRLAPNGLWRLK